MGFVSRIQASMDRGFADEWYNPGGSFYGGLPLLIEGYPVSPETAIKIITVQKCVRVRAATIAQLPIHTYESLGNDNFKEADNFYLSKLLKSRPNQWMQSPIFWAMVESYVCLKGNFIAYKYGLRGGLVRALIPITNMVTKIEQNDDYSLTYFVKFKNGEIKPIPQDQVMHIRGLLTLDGINGLNPIEYAAENIGLSKSQVTFLNDYFRKGMHPGAVFEHPQNLNAQAYSNLKANLKKKYEGLGKNWEMMLVDEGMKVQFPKVTLVDAQYLEIMKLTHDDICGLFRVPPMLVQGGNSTPTFASSEQFFLNYSIIGVAPDCRNYEETIHSDLMTPKEQEKYYCRFNLDALVRGDFKTRMEGLVAGVNSCILNPNQARKKLDLAPYYPEGELYKTRTSTTKEDNNSNTKTPDKKPEKGAAK